MADESQDIKESLDFWYELGGSTGGVIGDNKILFPIKHPMNYKDLTVINTL